MTFSIMDGNKLRENSHRGKKWKPVKMIFGGVGLAMAYAAVLTIKVRALF